MSLESHKIPTIYRRYSDCKYWDLDKQYVRKKCYDQKQMARLKVVTAVHGDGRGLGAPF